MYDDVKIFYWRYKQLFKFESILVKNLLDKKENKMRENFYIVLIKNIVKEIKYKIQILFYYFFVYIFVIYLDSRCIKYIMYIY